MTIIQLKSGKMNQKYRLPVKRAKILLIAIPFLSTICHGQMSSAGKSGDNTGACYSFPLKMAKQENRYLSDQNNRPFFWLGDAAWSLIAQLNRKDVDYYLDNRKEKGFSVILVSLIEHKFSTNAPSNYYGELPFIGRLFSAPNEKYFENADYVIETAGRRNIIVLLAPLYLGYDCKDEGWCAEVQAASENDLYAWGKYVGARYKKFGNIIWIIGGDTDPSPVRDKVLAMVRGIRENDSVHLFSAHNHPETMAVTPWEGESWLTVNNVYSYDSVLYRQLKTAYDIKPEMPFYLCESVYENEHNSTPQELRMQAYEAVLSGAMGHIFGNCPIWHFGSFKSWCNLTDWKTELDNNGSVDMDHFQKLFRSRSWYSLIPDFDHSAITSGYGNWGSKDYVTAGRTKDGNTIIAYLPSSREITADLSKVAGKKSRCWWYNPSSGQATLIGLFSTSGSQRFTPVSKGDWVLVIDSDEVHLPVPGKPE
jgi:Protein of unknown function (DUF4038)/Putative collagen-binding domain of a collagenase